MNHGPIKKTSRIFCAATFGFLLGNLSLLLIKEQSAMAQTAMPAMERQFGGSNGQFTTNNFRLSSPANNLNNQTNSNFGNSGGSSGSQPMIDFQTRLNGGENRNTSLSQRFGNRTTASPSPSQAAAPAPGSADSGSGTTNTNGQSPSAPAPSESPSAPAPSGGGTRVDVGSSSALATALGNARCGQSIIVGNGTYSGNFRVAAECGASNPLIVRAATPQQAVISSFLEVRGSHIHVRGFYFLGGNAHMTVYGNDHKVIGNKFEGWAVNTALSLYSGRTVEVAYNEFTKPDPFRSGSLGNYPLRIGIRSSHLSSQFHVDAHIHRNYFHDFPAKPNPNNYHSGQTDAIEVCFTGSTARSGWLIEYNLIDRHRQGHGVLDVKCANGTTVRFNTLINSPGGRLDLRNGNGGKMIANWIENAGGIGIQADNHEISGNVLTGDGYPELVLGTGDVASNGVNGDTQSANRNTLTCNRGTQNVGKYNLSHPARDNVVNAPNGRVILGKQVNTKVSPNANCNGVPQARRLSANEVGLQGLARSGL